MGVVEEDLFGLGRTFRKGQIGGWREEFSEEHAQAARETAGQLLVELGYEADPGVVDTLRYFWKTTSCRNRHLRKIGGLSDEDRGQLHTQERYESSGAPANPARVRADLRDGHKIAPCSGPILPCAEAPEVPEQGEGDHRGGIPPTDRSPMARAASLAGGLGSFRNGPLRLQPRTGCPLCRQDGMRAVCILRDPRDVAVSQMHYIKQRSEHFAHEAFLKLPSDRERLLHSIRGGELGGTQATVPR